MAVAYFNQQGKCVSIALNATTAAMLSEEVPFGAILHSDQAADDIYYDTKTNQVKTRGEFHVLVDGNTIRNIPSSTTAHVAGQTCIVDDGSLTIEGNLSAIVPVALQHARYKDTIVEVRT